MNKIKKSPRIASTVRKLLDQIAEHLVEVPAVKTKKPDKLNQILMASSLTANMNALQIVIEGMIEIDPQEINPDRYRSLIERFEDVQDKCINQIMYITTTDKKLSKNKKLIKEVQELIARTNKAVKHIKAKSNLPLDEVYRLNDTNKVEMENWWARVKGMFKQNG